MTSPNSAELSLLSKLESLLSSSSDRDPDEDDIYTLFCNHLRPFSDLSSVPNLKKASKSASQKQQQQQQDLTRSLAKQYLSFLNRSLSVLPKLLSAPRANQSGLFQAYRLCIRCLEFLSSQLSCKPYSIHLQRLRLMRCLDSCELYADSWDEGFSVLKSLRDIDSGGSLKGKVHEGYLPDMLEASEDNDFVILVVEIVVVLVKCLSMVQSKDHHDYERIIQLVEEAMPWFRILDAKKYEMFLKMLVTYLGKSALFLVAEKSFGADLVRSFSMACLIHYADSPLKGQTFKVVFVASIGTS
ncbi:hypothetical protein SAY87_020700 [Trapa incisa]|uniref:Separase-like TPR repeats region domain-containing protein n=1 Tax=Trapa incisa TaxID=236973 RepID=A0AAN7JQK2_9MYRT|nr:hypothetical protein SAY87_020700 [Trapa incisa]